MPLEKVKFIDETKIEEYNYNNKEDSWTSQEEDLKTENPVGA